MRSLRYSRRMDSKPHPPMPPHDGWRGYAWAAGGTAVCTLAGLAMEGRFNPVNIAMVYLLAVVLVSTRYSRGAAVTSALLCVLAFDFIFVPPRWTFAVEDAQYLLTFAILVVVAWVISTLTRDIREQAHRQAALETEAETERIRSALLASISHDLRTPLSVIAGLSSSLAEADERVGPEERKALAQSLFDQTRAVSEQVAKVLQMTRLESGSITPERDWNSLPDLAGAVLNRLRKRLAEHRVMTDFAADLPLVRVDAMLIDHVFSNLLENAARYTPAGTLIRVRGEVDEGQVVVSVEDFGTGLEPEDFERIFAKFHRGHSEGKITGAGLGLSICRAIVTLHRGRIWAERMPGGGTAFRFTLPLEPVPEVPAEAGEGR